MRGGFCEMSGKQLLREMSVRGVLITRGPNGMALFERGKKAEHLPTEAREVYDVTGAGDAVIAAMALSLAGGADMRLAARTANAAGGAAVSKLGAAYLAREELV